MNEVKAINMALAKENVRLQKEIEHFFDKKNESAKFYYEERDRRQKLEAAVCNFERLIKQNGPIKIEWKDDKLCFSREGHPEDQRKYNFKSFIEALSK